MAQGAVPAPLEFREQLRLTGDLLESLMGVAPPALKKCVTELGQAIRGWLSLPQAAAIKAMGPALQGFRPTLRALGLSSHSNRLTSTHPTEPLEAARQLYRLATLLQTAAIRPRNKMNAPAVYVWIDDKVGTHTGEIEWIASRGPRPRQCTTLQKAIEMARSAGEENIGFITNSYRKDDGKERTVLNLLEAIKGDEWGRTPVLVYMGTDPAPFYLPIQVKEPMLIATMDAALLRYYADNSFPLYDAEKHVESTEGVMLLGSSQPRPSLLQLTTMRLLFLDMPPFTTAQPWSLLIDLPLGVVYKVEETLEKETGKVTMKLYCRDFRSVSFVLPKKNTKLTKALSSYNVDGSLSSCLAGQHELESDDSSSYPASGWYLYSQGWDFERMGLREPWLVLVQNDFDICANYPETIVLPSGLSNAELTALRKSRFQGALPVLSYYYARTGGALLRASIESSDIAELARGGEGSSVNEKFLGIFGQRPITIVDVGSRSGTSSRATTPNVARQFLDLGSTQDVTTITRRLLMLRKINLTQEWIESIAQVGYLDMIQRILCSVQSLASLVSSGNIVIIQSEDGADMCALLVSLIALLLDPYYRSLSGIAFVIEREWLLHGSLIGWKRKRSKWNDELKLCAPFVVFIDCVWQLWNVEPSLFQYGEVFLQFILSNVYSARFGTFICSSEYERQKHKLVRRTYSIWQEVSCLAGLYENPLYDPRAEANLLLSNTRWYPQLWHSYYLCHLEHQLMHDTAQRLKFMAKQEENLTPQLKIEGLSFLPENTFSLVPFSPVHLTLSGNYIAHLPISLASQTQLKRLLLNRNRFTSIPQGVLSLLGENLQLLTELDLSENDIRWLPLEGFKSLRTLRLANNRLTELSSGLSKMTELALLNVARNQLTSLPERLPCSLTIIDAESNALADLPMDFSNKTNLQVLRLSHNDVAYFAPETFQHMSKLRILTLSHNNLGNQAKLCRAPQEEQRKISSIARQMTRTINRSNNSAPPRTPPSGQSISVDVELCLPSSLPASPLAELDLSHLYLPFVPTRVFLLVHLVELYLHHNRLPSLSTEISRLERLRVLDLQDNQITYIPLEIGSCTTLECLLLSRNQLRELTPIIGKIQTLTSLDLSSNPLRELPHSIGQLTRLKKLAIEGLELENVPKEIMQDPSAVRGYLQDLSRGSEPLWRVKLMVAGQENVGKTSLLRALMRKKKHDGMATDGIQLDTWTIDVTPDEATRFIRAPQRSGMKPPQSITVSTWDFAGQDIYYAAHQFFLSDRSIYLLVWNLAKPESEQRLSYWLQTISSRCPRSPIILVATHLDDKVCTEEYVTKTLADVDKRLRPLARQLRVIRAVSCETFKGMEDLRQEIETLVFSLDKIGDSVPSAYLALERFALEERKVRQPPVVSFSAWVSIAQSWGVLDESGIAAATTLLHNLGSICHYPQIHLKDMVILDPQWLIDITAALFSIKHNFARNGILAQSALLQIWRESRFPPSLHPFIVQLLERFELLFRLQPDPTTAVAELLVPDLLPDSRPSTFSFHWPHTWHTSSQEAPARSYLPQQLEIKAARLLLLGRRYELSFSPRGLFGRFMVRLLRFTNHLCLWQHGLIVEREGERLMAFASGDQIELFVAVDKRKTIARITLLQQASEVLVSILRSWYNVEFRVSIMCACCLARNRPRGALVYNFSLAHISDAIVSGHSVISCAIEGTSVRIDQMAPELLFAAAPTLDVNALQVGPKIGEGSYAVVHLGIYRSEKVAVKRMRLLVGTMANSPPGSPRPEAEQDRDQALIFEDFRRELAMLTGLSHPNLLRLVGYLTKPLCIVTEYMNAGDLWALARNTAVHLPWGARMLLAHQVATGVAYLHGITPPILHRDLKSPNILLHRDEAHRITAKLADFGLATALASKTALGRVVDNPVWLAPEVLAGQEYAEAADIYSVAVIMWELAARNDFLHEVPFWNAKEQHVIAGGRSEIPADTPTEMHRAIVMCWDNDPSKRPSMASVAALLHDALPPGTECIVSPTAPPFAGAQAAQQQQAEMVAAFEQQIQKKAMGNSTSPPRVAADDNDERPPQSTSLDLLAVTLVSPRSREQGTDWTAPSLASRDRLAVRIGSPVRALSPPGRTSAPNSTAGTSGGSGSGVPPPSAVASSAPSTSDFATRMEAKKQKGSNSKRAAH